MHRQWHDVRSSEKEDAPSPCRVPYPWCEGKQFDFSMHETELTRSHLQTNIPFLFRLLTHDVFIGGKTWTTVSCMHRKYMGCA